MSSDQTELSIVIERIQEFNQIAAWNQATLPVAKGGLGLKPALEVALSGYLSSVCVPQRN